MFAVSRVAERLDPAALQARGPAAIPPIALALALVVPLVSTVSLQLSRRVEARADAFSLRLTDEPQAFIDFEQRIAVRNVSDPDPPGWRTALFATHPPTIERIGAAVAYERGAR
jgi:Zn-dependent protease with chaperone function